MLKVKTDNQILEVVFGGQIPWILVQILVTQTCV
jgi:hypothetical protein